MFLFQEKGPIPTTEYIFAKPEQRVGLKSKSNYRFTGIIMLTLSIVLSLEAIAMIFSIHWMYIVVVGVCLALAVYVVAYTIKEEKKRKR
jgi:uncharacterized membrane protein